jgi:hypothetical protein
MNSHSLAILATLCISLAGCGDANPQNQFTLLEVIKLAGTCKEDHANKYGDYSGIVVRWRNSKTGDVSTYGSVNSDAVKYAMNIAEHPTEYQPPFLINFDEVPLDTRQDHWTLHGVSNSRGSDEGTGTESGYESTRELDVLGKSNELPDLYKDKQPKQAGDRR